MRFQGIFLDAHEAKIRSRSRLAWPGRDSNPQRPCGQRLLRPRLYQFGYRGPGDPYPGIDSANAEEDRGEDQEEQLRLLAHELRNTLFATDMLLERALEPEQLGTDPMEDVRRARAGIQETLAVIKQRLNR